MSEHSAIHSVNSARSKKFKENAESKKRADSKGMISPQEGSNDILEMPTASENTDHSTSPCSFLSHFQS